MDINETLNVNNIQLKADGELQFNSGISLLSLDGDNISVFKSDGTFGNLIVEDINIKGKTIQMTDTIYTINDTKIMLKNTDASNVPIGDIEIVVDRGIKPTSHLLWSETDEVWKAGIDNNLGRIITSNKAEFDTDILIHGKIKFDSVDGAPSISYYNNSLNIESRDKDINIWSGQKVYVNDGEVLTTKSKFINASTIGGIAIDQFILSNTIPSIDIGKMSNIPSANSTNSLYLDSDSGDIYINNSNAWEILGSIKANQSDSKSYTHNQIVPMAQWDITHNLNKYPSITISDSSGNVVMGDIKYNSLNDLSVYFSSEFSGIAYLI